MEKSRIEKIVIQSKSLNKEMSILVYLPCGYDQGQSFPTLYFLHGRSGNENILIDLDLNIVADRMIEQQEIDKQFKTIRNRNGRYIGGASAGGYTVLHHAFRHPEMFSKVGGHMPAIELQLEEEDQAYFQSPGSWEKYDPIRIASEMKCTDFRVYLDAGDQDEGGFYQGCSILHNILKEKGIESQNHVFKGHHSLEYIKSNIEKYMKFYGKLTERSMIIK